jgi:protein-ribulosamine 3-kinase
MPSIPAIILDHLPPSLKATDLHARSGPLLFHEPTQSTIFTKVAKGKDVPQLIGEAEGLRAMGTAAPDLVPKLYAFGYDDPPTHSQAYMITEWFEMAGSWRDAKHQRELGRKLAEMHRYRVDAGHGDRFGFSVPTHCGVTEQDNTWEEQWDVFYRDRRLRDLVRRIGDPAISQCWEKMKARYVYSQRSSFVLHLTTSFCRAVPLLLSNSDPPPKPVILHGDLWSGNVGLDSKSRSPVIFDPASYYGHNEADLGITHMFGGKHPWITEQHRP